MQETGDRCDNGLKAEALIRGGNFLTICATA